MQGDDKPFARNTAKRNREERTGATNLAEQDISVSTGELDQHSREIDAVEDDSPKAIRHKKKLYEKSHRDPEWTKQKMACDLWTAAFFQQLQPNLSLIHI